MSVKKSKFLSFLYSKPLRGFRKPKSKLGDRVCISKYDLPIRMDFKPQFTQEVFEIVALFSRKPPIYTIKDKQDEFIHGKFHQKESTKVSHLTMESFTIELVFIASVQLFPDNTINYYTNFLPEQLNLKSQWEFAISGKFYPSIYQFGGTIGHGDSNVE